MLAPRRINTNRRARPHPLPAPVGGINRRDAITAMRAEDAVDMVNFFPGQSSVDFRRGYERIATLGTSAPVRMLIPYHYGVNRKLLAFSGTSIYELIPANSYFLTDDNGPTLLDDDDEPLEDEPELLSASHLSDADTSGYVSHVQVGARTIMCNGVDTPFSYDGSDIIAHGWTDASTTLDFADLSFVFAFNSRVYFVEKDTQSFWYGGVGAVQGALEKFDLALTGTFRGSLKLLTAITNDGGDGLDDLFVAIFSEGDVVVYRGSDPGDVANWTRVGTYRIGEPLSRFAHTSNGGDITVVTSRGYESLVRSTREGEGVKSRSMISDRIQKEVIQITKRTGDSDDWRLVTYNRGQMLIVQAPLATSPRHHVQNIDTARWTRFDLSDVRSFAILDRLCFVGDKNGRVHVFDTGDTDDGKQIVYSAQCAWNHLGPQGYKKIMQYLLLNITASHFPSMRISVANDFKKFLRSTTIGLRNQEDAVAFGEAYWDDANYWSGASQTREIRHKHGSEGKIFSLSVTAYGRRDDASWNAVTYYTTPGGLI
jgi:hypothetical protein